MDHVGDRGSSYPHHFRIRVAGRLDPGFAAALDPTFEQSDVAGTTTLTGAFADQSQLFGILDQLRRLGIDVLKFETLPPGVLERPGGRPDHSIGHPARTLDHE